MSGGSYNYRYSKIDQVKEWAADLESMANRVEAWAARGFEVRANGDGAFVFRQANALERAIVHMRAVELRAARAKVLECVAALQAVEDLMHDVEWTASCDYGPDSLIDKRWQEAIEAVEKSEAKKHALDVHKSAHPVFVAECAMCIELSREGT